MATMIELWSGSGRMSEAFQELGYKTVTLDMNPKLEPNIVGDIMNWDKARMIDEGFISHDEEVEFIWASPECTYFSIANQYPHFVERKPASPEALNAIEQVTHTLDIIESFNSLWMLENPRGFLRFVPMMKLYPRRTIDYCMYGHPNQKPTDLWGSFPAAWTGRGPCSHSRHDKTEYQAGNAYTRAELPRELCREIAQAVDQSEGISSWKTLREWI